MVLVEIESPIAGAEYHALLRFAGECSDAFSLVWRDKFRFENSACDLVDELRPLELRAEHVHDWPLTTLVGHKATVRYYRCTAEALHVLRARSSGVYEWLEPSLPEDLAFWQQGSWWFGSVSYEDIACINEGIVSLEAIRAAVPGIRFRPSD